MKNMTTRDRIELWILKLLYYLPLLASFQLISSLIVFYLFSFIVPLIANELKFVGM